MASGPWGRRSPLGRARARPPPARAVGLAVVLPVGSVIPVSSSVVLAPGVKPSVSATEIIRSPVSSVMASEITVLIDSWVVPFSVVRWRIGS